ncbi:MarR family winged helix-turn-helix transcriptional regulator [Couchioplanes caeruleus]|uniref:HTH marR-type domain-containing protein n=2 Tax=Couchioplanes caeruleus TaxID=56438 RepID=A0A1K0GVF2_9ACTN|nr:MarR family winged helix-turn-helix transcriptional regulator [Couchioplanes caeruleus]OJF13355.1 hypothetical protein BG844_15645 [Couchioplanes caeruleus subsp. caeruleus]ROP33569.1 DNA-binding MarR family transcriptional regulator [Couchioplanes caeruleus]
MTQPTTEPEPEPSLVEQWAWYGLIRAREKLTLELERELQRAHGLPLSWLEILMHLAKQPAPRKITDVVSTVLLSQSQTSRALDQMVGRGLVTRASSTDDARARTVALTDAGRRVCVEGMALQWHVVREQMLDRLSPAQVQILAQIWQELDAVPANALDHKTGP